MTSSISPRSALVNHHGARCYPDGTVTLSVLPDGTVTVQWRHREGYLLRLNANLAMTPTEHFEVAAGRELWLEGRYSTHGVFEPWTVQWQMIGE